MEIQVGEYVRVMGIITKLFKIVCKGDKKTYYFDRKVLDGFNFLSQYGIDQLVRKHSFEIIDLIEVGDYVNGQKAVGVSNVSGWIDTKEDVIHKDHIKSIVTKEQFKSMEYEVK